MMDTAATKLMGTNKESAIIELLERDNICHPENLDFLAGKVSGIDPRVIGHPCIAILGSYEEELTNFLMKRNSNITEA